jgi:hypothetical protein
MCSSKTNRTLNDIKDMILTRVFFYKTECIIMHY